MPGSRCRHGKWGRGYSISTRAALLPLRAMLCCPCKAGSCFTSRSSRRAWGCHQLVCLLVAEDLHDGEQNDLDVQHRRPMPKIVEIEIDARFHLLELRGFTAAA